MSPELSDASPARQAAYALRARTRWISTTKRERGCGVFCVEHVDSHPSVEVRRTDDGELRAKWKGLLTCGHIHTCPVCSQNIRSKRAEKLGAAVVGLGGRWQMLTLTLQHREGLQLKPLYAGLMSAWRKTRQGGRIQRLWSEKVTASVRATEVTFGGNGWHPHLHVLLRTEDWTDDERAALRERFQSAIESELGAHRVPSDAHALYWSDAFDGSDEERRQFYMVKLGFEVSGLGKVGRKTATHWEVAARACDGDAKALWLWHEYYDATKGKRALELDDRANAAAKAEMQKRAAISQRGPLSIECPRCHAAPGVLCDDGVSDASDAILYCASHPERQVHDAPPLSIEVRRDEVRALRRLEGWRDAKGKRPYGAIMARVLSAAESDGSRGVRLWVSFALEKIEKCRLPPSMTSKTLSLAS